MITVIVPVLNYIDITNDFFETIAYNTVLPTQVILIDNGSTDPYPKLVKKFRNRLNILYIRYNQNKGVNEAWNHGIQLSRTKYISILNNDILLNRYFFETVKDSMENDSKIGIIVPQAWKFKDQISEMKRYNPKLRNLGKREGFAFTIRKDIIEKIDLIPSDLKIYCGDDYLFFHTQQQGYKIMKMTTNYIFHYGQLTSGKAANQRDILNSEKRVWKKIVSEF